MRIIAGLTLCCVALIAHAEAIDFWNFRGAMPRETGVSGLTKADITDDGLLIQTHQEGWIGWDNHPLSSPVDVITVRLLSATPVRATLLWQPTDGTEGGLYQAPFDIPSTGDFSQNVDIVVSNYQNWDWETERFALLFPANTSIIIEEINLRHWTPMEKIIETWKSFWTFDKFDIYSINFLWGPLTTTNPVARAHLFDNLPPFGWSALRILYAMMSIAIVVSLIIAFVKQKKELGLGVFFVTFAALWIVFDLRMGAEIISYARTDIREFILKENAEKILRTHGNLHAAVERSIEVIKQYDRFVLFAPNPSPHFSLIRYMAYPSVLVTPDQPTEGVRLWAVFQRSDIGVDEQGHLWKKTDSSTGRDILTGTGEIVLQFDDYNYLFVTNE